MIVTVKFEKNWSEEFLQEWIKNSDAEYFDDLTMYDRDELKLLALLHQDERYRKVDIETLHKMAEKAMWVALDIHMSEIIDEILCLNEVKQEMLQIMNEDSK